MLLDSIRAGSDYAVMSNKKIEDKLRDSVFQYAMVATNVRTCEVEEAAARVRAAVESRDLKTASEEVTRMIRSAASILQPIRTAASELDIDLYEGEEAAECSDEAPRKFMARSSLLKSNY